MLRGYDYNHLGEVSHFTVTVGNFFDNNDQGKPFQIQQSVKTMNNNDHWKLITSYLIRNRTQGFTLLELAIVFLLATPRPLYINDTHKITSAIIWQGVSAKSLVCEGNDSNVTPVIVSSTECQNGKFTY